MQTNAPVQQKRLNHLLPLIYKPGLLAHCTLRGKIGQKQSTSNKLDSSRYTAGTNTSERPGAKSFSR